MQDLTYTLSMCILKVSVNLTTTNPMSKRINIVLPDETVSVLDRVATKGTRSTFISKAVLHYVETHGRQTLRKQLEAGYRENKERNLAIAAEWFPLEEEASKKVTISPKVKKTSKTKRP
jgi:metal-responsive CopG/Arc/MetJ family transcriptional regulator